MTFTSGTHKVGKAIHKATKADKKALKAVNAECKYIGDYDSKDADTLNPLWEYCVFGGFAERTGRIITDADINIVEHVKPGTDGEGVDGMIAKIAHHSHKFL